MRWENLFLFYLGLNCVMTFSFAVDQCRSEVNEQEMALEGFVFKKILVPAPFMCDVECEKEITCQSYNYIVKENICELNNRTKEARPENFRRDPSRFYIRRLAGRVPLGSIPELPAQSCHEIRASEGRETKGNKYWIDQAGNGTARLGSCEESMRAWYNFTTLGATKRHGPDNSTGYRGTGCEGVQVKGGKQEWTVPFTGRFHLEACGASGGRGLSSAGGKGAKINGTVRLEKGVKLVILVGQRGSSRGSGHSGSGGGGTFVLYSPRMRPLLVAGGGGGGGSQNGHPGNDQVDGSGNGAGSNGEGGLLCGDPALAMHPDSGSGAGINGSGGCFKSVSVQSGQLCMKTDCEKGGKSFIVGGEGGKADSADCHGGFGGGGACHGDGYPGGGGGYSGGGVDSSEGWSAGGGGGSFVENPTWIIIKGGCDEGDGYVSFTRDN